MKKQFKNKKREEFLKGIPSASIELDTDILTLKCKFNFAYFDSSQKCGDDFSDWTHDELVKLFEKLKNYSKNSLKYWMDQKVGRYPVFVKYDRFPIKSDFTEPKHIPHQAVWARFHLENKPRLVGFTVPDDFHNKVHTITGEIFDSNTFYVVFLDKEHKFYKTK